MRLTLYLILNLYQCRWLEIFLRIPLFKFEKDSKGHTFESHTFLMRAVEIV